MTGPPTGAARAVSTRSPSDTSPVAVAPPWAYAKTRIAIHGPNSARRYSASAVPARVRTGSRMSARTGDISMANPMPSRRVSSRDIGFGHGPRCLHRSVRPGVERPGRRRDRLDAHRRHGVREPHPRRAGRGRGRPGAARGDVRRPAGHALQRTPALRRRRLRGQRMDRHRDGRRGPQGRVGRHRRVPVSRRPDRPEGRLLLLPRPARALVLTDNRKEPLMAIDPKRTAVVLIEFQNDFTSDGGVLHDAVRDVMESTGMLDNTRELAEAAREAGATIVHAPITFAPGYGELSDHPYGILKGVVDSTAFVKGEWGAEIVDALAPQEGDVVVEGKRGLDTFATTNLDFILRARGITTIALGGFLTNCCVESTMRTGYEKGYQVITLSDCVAATSPEEHENAIRFDFPMFSQPMRAEEFASSLAGERETADAS